MTSRITIEEDCVGRVTEMDMGLGVEQARAFGSFVVARSAALGHVGAQTPSRCP
jgi:hypothetical protein